MKVGQAPAFPEQVVDRLEHELLLSDERQVCAAQADSLIIRLTPTTTRSYAWRGAGTARRQSQSPLLFGIFKPALDRTVAQMAIPVMSNKRRGIDTPLVVVPHERGLCTRRLAS